SQIWKCRKLALLSFPHGGIANIIGVAGRIRQQPNAPVAACLVEAAFPARRRPIFGASVDQQPQCASMHRNLALHVGMAGDSTGLRFWHKIFPLSCRKRTRSFVLGSNGNIAPCSTPSFATTMRTSSVP